jgi:hypothetical protein
MLNIRQVTSKMLKPLPPTMAVAFTDLIEAAHDAAFNERFPPNGSFHQMKRGDRAYWYHVMRDPTVASGRRSTYAGAVGDPTIDALVAKHGDERQRHKIQKASAALLRRAGLPSPLPIEGELVRAFQRAGLFHAGAVLVGSVAYQCYGGLLGFNLGGDLHRTQDLDLAQDRIIAIDVSQIGDAAEDFEAIIRKVDASFKPDFNPSHPKSGPTRYVNAANYKIDLLTPQANSDRIRSAPIELDILPGAALQPLALMDYLIENPVRSVLLFEEGIAVVVPDPARYAIHKIVLSQIRASATPLPKTRKDRAQVEQLIEALVTAGRTPELAEAFGIMWTRYPKVRASLAQGALALGDKPLTLLAKTCHRFGQEPFAESDDPIAVLRPMIPGSTTPKTKPGGPDPAE